jgi:hypothetical protein
MDRGLFDNANGRLALAGNLRFCPSQKQPARSHKEEIIGPRKHNDDLDQDHSDG